PQAARVLMLTGIKLIINQATYWRCFLDFVFLRTEAVRFVETVLGICGAWPDVALRGPWMNGTTGIGLPSSPSGRSCLSSGTASLSTIPTTETSSPTSQ